MSKVVGSVSKVLNEKVVQVSLVGGILFFLLANTKTLEIVENMVQKVLKMVNLDLSLKGTGLLVFHSIVYSLFLYLILQYLLQPVVRMIKA